MYILPWTWTDCKQVIFIFTCSQSIKTTLCFSNFWNGCGTRLLRLSMRLVKASLPFSHRWCIQHRVLGISPCRAICKDSLSDKPVGVIICECGVDLPYSKFCLQGISYGRADLLNFGWVFWAAANSSLGCFIRIWISDCINIKIQLMCLRYESISGGHRFSDD